MASGRAWRRTSVGLYVPAWVDRTVVEQHVLEQETRIRSYGAVSAWASLRWRGATYFDGTTRCQDGSLLPVPLLLGPDLLRSDGHATIHRGQLAPEEREIHQGLRCAVPARALFDEVVRLGSLRPAVVAIDMASAAGLIAVADFQAFLATVGPRNGVVLAREAAALARDTSWSPQESWMRLCWVLDAGLPEPHCNVPVFDLAGNLLGIPDLFDERAGVVGEYQGEVHRERGRQRRDVARAERFREHDLEYFEVVAGDLSDSQVAVSRMRAVRARARFHQPDTRTWTLDPPTWWLTRTAPSRLR